MDVKGGLHNPCKEPALPTGLRIVVQPSSKYRVTAPTDISWLQSVELFMIEFISFWGSMKIVLARINTLSLYV
jgi:hypothetical protein